mmetsp:Transcript_78686/g.218540  ORF Transcript_78686/g.218540 Transcript_78686/m.218540 type:complete len:386 (-) Transcript_78686:114-1271(-)
MASFCAGPWCHPAVPRGLPPPQFFSVAELTEVPSAILVKAPRRLRGGLAAITSSSGPSPPFGGTTFGSTGTWLTMVAGVGAVTGVRLLPPRMRASGSRTLLRVRKQKRPQEKATQRLREVESMVAEVAEEDVDVVDIAQEVELNVTPAAVPRYMEMRQNLPRLIPFLPEPGYRKFAANEPGDVGFDPLGLCTDVAAFVRYREAEFKHGRTAMLAALAWPLAEIAVPELSEANRIPDFLAESGGRFLPMFTGGLEDQFVEAFVTFVFITGASFELTARPVGSECGDFGYDPIGLSTWGGPPWRNILSRGRNWMKEAEIKHGRIAMCAILYDITDELLTGNPVVEDTEFFFHRLDKEFLSLEYWTFQPDALSQADNFPEALSQADFL